MLTAMGLHTGEIVLGWLIIGFLLFYTTKSAGFTSTDVLTAILTASGVGVLTFPAFGALSDRIGPEAHLSVRHLRRGAWPISAFLLLACLVAIICVASTSETAGSALR